MKHAQSFENIWVIWEYMLGDQVSSLRFSKIFSSGFHILD